MRVFGIGKTTADPGAAPPPPAPSVAPVDETAAALAALRVEFGKERIRRAQLERRVAIIEILERAARPEPGVNADGIAATVVGLLEKAGAAGLGVDELATGPRVRQQAALLALADLVSIGDAAPVPGTNRWRLSAAFLNARASARADEQRRQEARIAAEQERQRVAEEQRHARVTAELEEEHKRVLRGIGVKG